MTKLTRYVKDQIKYGVKDKNQIFIIYIYIYIFSYLFNKEICVKLGVNLGVMERSFIHFSLEKEKNMIN